MHPPTPPQLQRKRRLGEILMAAGMLDEQQLNRALSEQKKWGGKLGRTLVELGYLDEDTMVLALSRQLNLPLINLDRQLLAPEVTKLLRVDIAEQYGVFPLGVQRGSTLVQLATADPTNTEALQELAFHTNSRIQPVVATASAIDRAIRRYYYGETPRQATPSSAASPLEEAPPVAAPPSAPAAAPLPGPAGEAELAARVSHLSDRVDYLEQVVVGQVRALRGLLEVLLEKGVLSREEYLAKVRGRRSS